MFKFNNLVFYDTTHFVLSAVKANGKNSTKITYNGADTLKVNNVLSTSEPLIDSLPAGETLLMRKELLERLNYRGEMLKEVKIKAIKPLKTYETQSLAGAGHADQVIKGEELQQIGGRLITSLNGRLRGVVFLSGLPFLNINLNGLNGAHPMRLYVDGAELDAKEIGNYTTSEIETVEVLKSATATIYGVEGADGILIVTTKKGGGRNDNDITSKGILSIKPIGFYKARVFYSPRYNNSDKFKSQQDSRSPIYWNPYIQSDKNGNASFDYYTSDGVGKYEILLEGIDDNGNIGRHICTYVVH